MGGLLLGFAMGAMAFTEQGREIGDKLWAVTVSGAKKVMTSAAKPAKQPSGTAGDDSHIG